MLNHTHEPQSDWYRQQYSMPSQKQKDLIILQNQILSGSRNYIDFPFIQLLESDSSQGKEKSYCLNDESTSILNVELQEFDSFISKFKGSKVGHIQAVPRGHIEAQVLDTTDYIKKPCVLTCFSYDQGQPEAELIWKSPCGLEIKTLSSDGCIKRYCTSMEEFLRISHELKTSIPHYSLCKSYLLSKGLM